MGTIKGKPAKVDDIDSKSVVQATELPYVVPVDFIVRGTQILLLLSSLWAFYVCIKNPSGVTIVSWIEVGLFLSWTIFLQIRSSGLSFDQKGITKVSWFFLKNRIEWNEIESVVTGTRSVRLLVVKFKGALGDMDSSEGTYLMVLSRKDGSQPFFINIKPYSMQGLITLVHFLCIKTDQTQIDEATKKIIKRIVPSIFFGEQKGHG
jgi:hypothetical protein